MEEETEELDFTVQEVTPREQVAFSYTPDSSQPVPGPASGGGGNDERGVGMGDDGLMRAAAQRVERVERVEHEQHVAEDAGSQDEEQDGLVAEDASATGSEEQRRGPTQAAEHLLQAALEASNVALRLDAWGALASAEFVGASLGAFSTLCNAAIYASNGADLAACERAAEDVSALRYFTFEVPHLTAAQLEQHVRAPPTQRGPQAAVPEVPLGQWMERLQTPFRAVPQRWWRAGRGGMSGTTVPASRRVLAQVITGALVVGTAGQLVGLPPQFRAAAGQVVLDLGCWAAHMCVSFALWCPGLHVVGADIEPMSVDCSARNVMRATDKLSRSGTSFSAAKITLGHVDLDWVGNFEPTTAAYCYAACPELCELAARIVATTRTLRVLVFVAPHAQLLRKLLMDGIVYEEEDEKPLLLPNVPAEGGGSGYPCAAVPVTANIQRQVLERLQKHLRETGRGGDRQLRELLRAKDTPMLPMDADFTTLNELLMSDRFYPVHQR